MGKLRRWCIHLLLAVNRSLIVSLGLLLVKLNKFDDKLMEEKDGD